MVEVLAETGTVSSIVHRSNHWDNSYGSCLLLSLVQNQLLQCVNVNINRSDNFFLFQTGSKGIVRNSIKKEKGFRLGCTFGGKNKRDGEWIVEFVEKKGGVEPSVRSVTLKYTEGEIVLSADDAGKGGMPYTYCDKEQDQYSIGVNSAILDSNSPSFFLDRFRHRGERGYEEENALANYLQEKQGGLGDSWEWGGSPVFSMSPIRSQPKRTYDQMREFDGPEGSDIPIRLMRIKATNKDKWEALKARLVEFGKSAGLFHNIDVRNFGGAMGDPFKLTVKVRGPNSNVIDVGYGVSQILPILVNVFDQLVSRRRIYRSGRIPIFLLQQPEVHLHPRGAGGTFLFTSYAGKPGSEWTVVYC